MAKLQSVADYFLLALSPDNENDLTNMKLQKLCAYAQGLSLGIFGKPLFDEPIEAWEHGPVMPALYTQFKHWGDKPITAPDIGSKLIQHEFSDNERFILELTRHYYGDDAAHALRNRSHMDFPGEWGSGDLIPLNAIKQSFEKDALVKKLLSQSTSGKFDAARDIIVDEQEVWDALEA